MALTMQSVNIFENWHMSDGLHKRKVETDKAIFVVSIDIELAWGSFDRSGVETLGGYYAQEREIVTKLLKLLERYRISATWAVVGHLFLKSCSREGPDSHNRVLQPDYSWYPAGWLSHDPFSDAESEPFFYAPNMIDAILDSSQPKEIASHTFTHAILGDPECSREVALSQLAESRRVAKQKGVDLLSMVFPRNSVGHLDVLWEQGFLSYRSMERSWYHERGISGRLNRLCHFIDRFLALSPPVYDELDCYQCAVGSRWLVDLPASMFYVPVAGPWSLVSISSRVNQARKGLAEAVKKKALFHLWFHPVNLTTSPLLLEGLEEIFSMVSNQIGKGDLTSMTMAQTASHAISRLQNDGA